MAFARLSQPELLKLFEKSESDSISIKAKLNAVQSENEALLTENKQAKTTVLNLSSAVARLSETNLKLVSQNEELHRKCIELESSAKTTSNNAIAYGSPPKCFNTHSTEACSIQPMSCSKHLPPFTFDVLCYLNRDGLERFSIDCRPLKNLIERYFHSKPYRVFDQLWIRGGLYALCHNYGQQWHPNREDYSVQQFLARQKCSIDLKRSWSDPTYYSFSEMLPYLGPTVRIKNTYIFVDEDFTYNPEHITEMESISYLWRDGDICICHRDYRIVAEDFRSILNSPTILQCRKLYIENAHFSFKDYKVLYTVKMIENYNYGNDIDHNYWAQFLEQPGVKPLVVLRGLQPSLMRTTFANAIDRISKAFSSAISPNAFKIGFVELYEELTEFQETNNTSGEKLELKKGLPAEYEFWGDEEDEYYHYTLERSII